ncbi:MAG: serine/threonine-protein kinase [Pseudomonadota bacterium]
MSDIEALDWLDRLLIANESERAASLDTLATANPQLHARLQRLLASALAPENTRALVAPVLDGVVQLDPGVALAGGEVLAGYRLLRELGRGGMSVVWLAERADGSLKRAVALKMPLFMLQGAAEAERFARERDALALLGHPNVARLYDAGVLPSGQPFIVLENIAGAPLNEHCDSRALDLAARLALFLQVLAAVEHAHKHLIVHRDLKPSNILVDEDGQVKLLDFGIAKLLGEAESAAPLTQQIGGAMTPLYAAPEQIVGAAISTLTDVFSLGIVLHELLSGAVPYRGSNGARATLVEILAAFSRGALPRLEDAAIDGNAAAARGFGSVAKLRTALTGDLATIVGKALRIAPEDRYASAAHLADDLRRYIAHKPIAARPPGFWYVVRLAAMRHRLASTVAGIGFALVVGASVVAWLQYRESQAHAERTAAVRDFMFDMVNDAEATEGHDGEVTGKQMVDGAVARARRDFGAQPQLQGELLGELGRMYTRLGASEAAAPVLGESIAVLEKHAPADDAALNKSRVHLAEALLRTGGDFGRIRQLAMSARDACKSGQVDCTKARAYAGNILAQVASIDGDDATALADMRRSTVDTELGFGTTHEETVMSLLSLAVIARNAGQLAEAELATQRALTISQGLRLRAADRVTLERTMALIDLDLGHYTAARDRLITLITRTTAAGERALQQRILASVYVELGDGARGLQSADAALATLPQDWAAELPFARQARARALAASRQYAAALAEIDTVIRMLSESGHSPESFEVMRALRFRAEFLLAAGRVPEALTLLRDLQRRHRAGNTSPTETGLMLDALGQAERQAGNTAAARAAHAAAQVALTSQLPSGHPYRVHNAALLAGAR